MLTLYPIRAVAKITGLSLDTLRAWERRYKAVVPERSDRGRQYGMAQIQRLVLLNQLVQKGHAIGGIASLRDDELERLLTEEPAIPPPEASSSGDLLVAVLSAIENFDPVRAGDELGRLAAVLTPRDLVYSVALPLMREVGIRWHNGTLAIAQEHLISQLLRNLLGSMMRLFRTPGQTVKMVLATPAHEFHEFGILASAMLVSMAGIEPVYLGPNLPAHEIARAAQRVSARIVLLGITVVTDTTAAEVRAVAADMPQDVELWIGGAGASGLDLPDLDRRHLLIKDLPALENECRRRRDQ